jgi:hypothetical protein
VTAASSTIAHSSMDGIAKPTRPDHSEEWLADYRQRLQAGINRRKPPEGGLARVRGFAAENADFEIF